MKICIVHSLELTEQCKFTFLTVGFFGFFSQRTWQSILYKGVVWRQQHFSSTHFIQYKQRAIQFGVHLRIVQVWFQQSVGCTESPVWNIVELRCAVGLYVCTCTWTKRTRFKSDRVVSGRPENSPPPPDLIPMRCEPVRSPYRVKSPESERWT